MKKKADVPRTALTNGKVVAAAQLMTRFLSTQIPTALRLRALRLARHLREEADLIDKARVSLAEKHAERDAAGNPKQQRGARGTEFALSDASREAFQQEYQKLLDEPSELAVTPLPLNELLSENGDNAGASVVDLLLLLCELGIVHDPEYEGKG